MSVAMRTLVLAEHDNHTLKPATWAALAAARQLPGDCDVLLAGSDCAALAHSLQHESGAQRVLHVDAAHYADGLPESLALLLAGLAPDYSHVVATSTAFGRNVLPRLAALLGAAPITDVVDIIDAATFVRPTHAGSVLETVRSHDAVRVIGVRESTFSARGADSSMNTQVGELIARPPGPEFTASRRVAHVSYAGDRPPLAGAKTVVTGGRGLVTAEHYRDLLGALADRFDGALGASREAVDAGYATNDQQIGQSGQSVAPELYFAIGVSGSQQHVAGIREARVVVAINSDPEAPIFEHADYGLVADLFEAVPALLDILADDDAKKVNGKGR